MNGWFSVQEAARLCGTDEQRITLWMNGNHIAFARFDTVLMIDGASLFALFERNRVATIYDDAPRQKKKGQTGQAQRATEYPAGQARLFAACRQGLPGTWHFYHRTLAHAPEKVSSFPPVLCPQLRQPVRY